MGMYRYITAEETAKMKQVSDPELNELLQEALEVNDTLIVEEGYIWVKMKGYKGWLYGIKEKSKDKVAYTVYHESRAHDDTPYQAMYMTGIGVDKTSVMTYLYGIINGAYGVTKKAKKGELSDGYHTHNELYEFRMLYNAALFNEWFKTKGETSWINRGMESVPVTHPKYDVHKSWKHHDGEDCFGGGWFIVVAVLPGGQISNHYEAKYWDLFQIPALDTAAYEWDGHTSQDVAERLKEICSTK